MLLLRRHLLPLLRAATQPPSPTHHRACLLSASASSSASAAPFCLEEYLVAACGLAPAQARKTAKKAVDQASKDGNKKAFGELRWSRLNSASNPNAVLALLSGVGLSGADIAAVVAADPLLLRSSVKNVSPRLLALRDCLGLSAPQIVRFLLVGSRALRCSDIVPKLEFFISLFGSFERLLVILKKNCSILSSNIERVIKPNIAQLCQCGLSVRDIAHVCSHSVRLLSFRPDRVNEIVLRVEELGVHHSSRMFKHTIRSVSYVSKEKFAARLELLKSTLGCTESEFATIVSKQPAILGYSEEGLLRKIQFWIKEVGVEPQCIVKRPILLSYSLEKRLLPRHCVMKILQEKGLLSSKRAFYSFARFGEETFKLKYIDCYNDSVPGLADAYATVSAGVVPSGIKL